MKITCEACGAKYTIADDKVQGRKVKVRCKNCKANILVDGSGDAGGSIDVDSGEPEAAAPAKPNAWSVNLSDDDSREMTTDEIVEGWRRGAVTQDAYVWRDGMADWKPILEVAELKMKVLALQGEAVAKPAAAPAKPAGDDLFGGLNRGAKGLSPVEDDDKKPTGARNESSVLFSLDALKTSVPEKKEKRSEPPAGDLFGGLSGLPAGGLLTNNLDLLTAPALEPPPAPVVKTPVAMEAPKKGNGALMGGIAAVLVVALAGGFFYMKGQTGEAAALASKEAEELKAKIAEAEKKAEAERAKNEEERKRLAADLEKVRAEALARGEDPAAAEKRKLAENAAKANAEKAGATGAAAPAAGETRPAGSGTTAAAAAPTAEKPKPAASSGGAGFDVASAKSALAAAAANVASCASGSGPSGSGKVQVTFAPSGRVTSATVVEGPFGGTAVGGCIASTFRRARIPAFDGAPQTVTKGFRL